MLLIAVLSCKQQLASPDTEPATDLPTTLPTPPTNAPLTDPEATGPQATTLRIEDLDIGRDREIRLRIHEPTTADTRVALVLTGFSLAPDLYDSYSEHLASHGYVSIGVNLRTSPFVRRSQRSYADDVRAVIDWIDTQEEGSFANLDASRVVIAGHSFGGKLGLMAALDDPRVYGVIGIDPVDSIPPGFEVSDDNPSLAPERMADFDFPMVFIGEDADVENCAPQGQNYRAYFDATPSPAVRVEIEGADHSSFLDNPDCGFLCELCADGDDDPLVTKQITRGLVYAYFEYILRNREGAREHLIAIPGHSDAGRVSINVANGF